MNILFLVPPEDKILKKIPERLFGCCYLIYPMPNIFSLICAAVLERNGYKVDYLDCVMEGLILRESIKRIGSIKPDCLCIYSVNLSMEGDINFARELRESLPGIKIIFMGPAPTYFSARFIIDKDTFVLRGEPEIALKELIGRMRFRDSLNEILGLTYLGGERIINNPSSPLIDDLDGLPFPARHLIEKYKKRYYNPKLAIKPFTPVLTSRGCGYSCIYCVPNSLSFSREIEFKRNAGFKPPVRFRSAENVIQEFNVLKSQGYKAISILDDQFIWEKKRIIAICSGIKKLRLRWGCLSRADHLSEDVVEAMAGAGCRYVDIGIESFDQRILDYIKKNQSLEKVRAGIMLLKKHKILAKVNVLFGAGPYETKETISNTLAQIKSLKPDIAMFNICNPFPGTEFYEVAKKNNWIINSEYRPSDVQKEAIIRYPHLNESELEKTVIRANLKFFFSPRFILRNIFNLSSLGCFKDSLTAFLRKVSLKPLKRE